MKAAAASAGEIQVAASTTVELQVAVQQRCYCGTAGGGDSAGGAVVKKHYNGAARGAAVGKNYSGAAGGATAEKIL